VNTWYHRTYDTIESDYILYNYFFSAWIYQ